MIMSYRDAVIEAQKLEKKLTLDKFTVKKQARVIAIQHMDGSYLEFHSACFKRLDKEWMVIFTEHHGTFVYQNEDVKSVLEWLSPKGLYWNMGD